MVGPAALPLTSADGGVLVRIATETVRARLCGSAVDGRPPRERVLRALGCAFVTLEAAGALRGCIGSLEPTRPLYRDVARNAVRAMTDPRLDPVAADEWPELIVSVSVLSLSEPVPVRSLADLCRMLRPHVDGLIVTVGPHQATFLPAVWEKLPDPAQFVTALLTKGGWAEDRLPAGAIVRRYTAREYRDGAPHLPLATPVTTSSTAPMPTPLRPVAAA